MSDPKIRPIKKPVINRPPNQRDPNSASPVGTPNATGNYINHDKDYSKVSEFTPAEVNLLHNRSDVDKSWFAQHHTLGPKRNQASPGDHDHTGQSARKLGYGLGLTLIGSKGGNVALAQVIELLNMFIDFEDNTT